MAISTFECCVNNSFYHMIKTSKEMYKFKSNLLARDNRFKQFCISNDYSIVRYYLEMYYGVLSKQLLNLFEDYTCYYMNQYYRTNIYYDNQAIRWFFTKSPDKQFCEITKNNKMKKYAQQQYSRLNSPEKWRFNKAVFVGKKYY